MLTRASRDEATARTTTDTRVAVTITVNASNTSGRRLGAGRADLALFGGTEAAAVGVRATSVAPSAMQEGT